MAPRRVSPRGSTVRLRAVGDFLSESMGCVWRIVEKFGDSINNIKQPHMGISIVMGATNGWLWKIVFKCMMTGATPISGNLYMLKMIESLWKVESQKRKTCSWHRLSRHGISMVDTCCCLAKTCSTSPSSSALPSAWHSGVDDLSDCGRKSFVRNMIWADLELHPKKLDQIN